MTAITFRTTDIALDHAREFDRHRGTRPVAIIEWLAAHGSRLAVHCLAVALRPVRNWVASMIEADTKRVIELGTILDGVRVRVSGATRTEYIDSSDELNIALEKLCEGLKANIADGTGAATALARLMPEARLVKIIHKHVEAHKSTLSSVTDLKWEIMEQDADVAIRTGDIGEYMSADDLIAHLQH